MNEIPKIPLKMFIKLQKFFEFGPKYFKDFSLYIKLNLDKRV